MITRAWILAAAVSCATCVSATLALPALEARQSQDNQVKDDKGSEIAIVSPANGATLSSALVDVAVSFSSKIESIEIMANGASVASFDVPKKPETAFHVFPTVNLTALSNTGLPVALRARGFLDKNGKKFIDSATVQVTVYGDATPPQITLTTPANGSVTSNAQAPLSAQITDSGGSGLDLSSLVVRLDDLVVNPTTTAVNANTITVAFTPANPLDQGSHTYTIDARDRAGNRAARAISAFVVDSFAPVLTLLPIDGGFIQGPRPTLVVSYVDSPAGVDLVTLKGTLDGAAVAFVASADSASFTPAAALPDGPHIWNVELADKAGNLAQVTVLFRVESGLGNIGTAGGVVGVTDPVLAGFGARLEVPPGALSQDVLFFIEEILAPVPLPEGYVSVGPALDFGPSSVFSVPVKVVVPYDPETVAARGLSPVGLRILTFDIASGMWVLVPVVGVDTENHLLMAEVVRIDGAVFQAAAPEASPIHSEVGVSSTNVVADGQSFTTITITPQTEAGSLLGPGQLVEVTVSGVLNPTVQIVDLGNGVYQVFISSLEVGAATVTISVNGVELPQQSIQFSPLPSSFIVEILNGPLTAGVATTLRITARAPVAGIVTLESFTGSLEVNLTGTRDASGVLVFPESFVATFSTSDRGVLTLPNALLFAQAGEQQVSVLYLNEPSRQGLNSATVQPGPAAALTKVSGDLQSGRTGSVLPQRLAVRVTDVFGNPVPGARVRFAVQAGDTRFTSGN